MAQPHPLPPHEPVSHQTPCHWARMALGRPRLCPFLTPPPCAEANGRPGRNRAQRPCHAAPAVYTLHPGHQVTTCRSSASRASATSSWCEVCALPPTAHLTRPLWPPRRAGRCPQEPRQRPPGSLARPLGLTGWPQPQGWVSGGSGRSPDPELRALPRGKYCLGVGRVGCVMYPNINSM